MNQKVRFYAWCLILTSSVFLLFSCTTVPYTGRNQIMLIDSGQELALSQRAAQEILSEVRLSQDPRYVNRVQEVGQRISRVSARPDYRWQFFVVDDSKQPNAFALPGGEVFVYTGMFQYAQTDPELATVIAHEVAHAIARHGAERMSNILLAQMGGALAAQALNIQSPGALQTFSTAYGLATNVGLVLPHSRSQEFEADRIGLILMAKAGYDPRSALTFWEKMMRSGKSRSVPTFLSTHPTDQQRLAQIQAFLPEAMKYYTGTPY